jgi:hypothetical protein
LDWVAALLRHLANGVALVPEEPASPPRADLHVYHVRDDPAHGFVYRALLREPGLVVLEDWNLHRLVHAETVGRGDLGAYRREARRAHGDTGSFVAEQVLAGRGGALASLVPLNDRVLEASLGLATTHADVRARAAARLGERPVVPLAAEDPQAAASVLAGLSLAVHADLERLRREAAADRGPEGTLLASALDELRPAAHALGLTRVPRDVAALVASLFPEER